MAYYGHGSWLIVVAFFAMFVIRRLGAGRGRSGRDRPPVGRYSAPPWEGLAPRDRRSGATSAPSRGSPGHTGIQAGWMPDPSGRYDQRYWSGDDWTEHVTKDGAPGTDPLTEGRPRGTDPPHGEGTDPPHGEGGPDGSGAEPDGGPGPAL